MKKLSILWIAILSVAGCLSCSDRTVNGTIRKYESNLKSQLQQNLSATNLTWPISKIAIVVLKEEKKLEVWGKNDEAQPWSIIKIYDVLAASGDKGPKLKEGDRQVPEGIYQLEGLNPKSSYHLSMKVNYPNKEDIQIAALEHREQLGGDIFIHGRNLSIGCVAIGNPAIEEVFTLGALAKRPLPIIISPRDFRLKSVNPNDWNSFPTWVKDRYLNIEKELKDFKKEAK